MPGHDEGGQEVKDQERRVDYSFVARNIDASVSDLCRAVVDAHGASAELEALEDLRWTLGAMCRQLSGPMGAPVYGTRQRTFKDRARRESGWLQQYPDSADGA